MPELIKKNWGFLLIGLALLVLLALLWPKQPEQHSPPPAPQIPQTNKAVETKKPARIIPSTGNEQLPAAISNDRAAIENDNKESEDEPLRQEEEGDEPSTRNYILCEHIVSGETQYEFTGEIRLINKGTQPVYGWSVNWEYEDGSTIIEASDVALGGNNPYTGEYLSWNAEIPPGKTVTFTFTGIKNGDSAPKRVDVKGNFCM